MGGDRRKLLILVTTILGSSIVFLDGTVVNVALPSIRDDLDAGLAGQLWVIEAYLLALVSVLLVGGSLGDIYGRRRMFEIGLVGFGATSILCAIAPTTELLIAGRALQGIAGGLLVPGSLAILAATFEGEERGRAVGLWTAWSGIATVAGPAGGGLLVTLTDWRWVFWINIPLVIVTLWLARRVVPESRDPEASREVDFVGIGLSAGGLGAFVYALIQQPTHGWGDPQIFVTLIVGVAALIAFVIWEARAKAPMLPLSLFRIRNFAVANISTLAVYAGLFGAITFVTLFLQEVAGYSPLEAGLATTPVTLLLFFLSPRFGALASGVGPRLPMGLGPIIGGVGLLLMLRVDFSGSYLTDVLPALLLFGVGLAMTVAPLTATVLDSVEERRAGIASGVNNAVSRVAGLVAIAVLGAVISGQFTSSVDESLSDRSLSPPANAALVEAKEAPFAGVDLTGLPEEERVALSPAITDASESGFHLGMVIGGVLLILGGVISAIWIRNPPRPQEVRADPAADPAPA
ncbi:MAG: MFS transporter [Solirubrobacterales bacterium]